jgi:hypothetical protein
MPLVKAGHVRLCMSIDQVRHVVVYVSHFPEVRIYTTECGATADSVKNDLVSRPVRDCETCIPFRKTR